VSEPKDASGTGPWEPVRESWTSPEPAPSRQPAPERREPATIPPQLPTSRQYQVETMLEMLMRSDYEGARIAADAVLRADPHDADARQCSEMAARELRKLYQARIGVLTRIPRPVRPREGTPPFVDARARLLMGAMDGTTTVAALVDSGALAPLDALRIVSELVLEGIVVLGAE
jgi:hypothetical protein